MKYVAASMSGAEGYSTEAGLRQASAYNRVGQRIHRVVSLPVVCTDRNIAGRALRFSREKSSS